MNKMITFAMVLALSVATVAEAKRGGGFKVAKSKPSTSQSQQQKNQQDADFNNTPNAIPNGAAAQAQQVQRGSGMNNFVTGAAAGYLLSNVLSPTEAQAQETGTQAVSSEQNVANPTAQLTQKVEQMANVPAFKQLDPTDPNMIERNANYSRYCLGGMQYLVSGSKAMVLVDSQNQPQRCVVTP